jgi:hypothetical protein
MPTNAKNESARFFRLVGRPPAGQFCAGGQKGRGSCSGKTNKNIFQTGVYRNTFKM